MANSLERVTLTGAYPDKKLRELQIINSSGRVQDELEHVEPYGFTSEPYTDSKTDAVVLYPNGQESMGLVIQVSDRRWRITGLKTGEVCIYDDKRHIVYLHNDSIEVDGVNDPIIVHTEGDITIKSGATINIQAQADININAQQDVTVTAGRDATVTAVRDLNLSAGRSFNMKAPNGIGIETDGEVRIKGSTVHINDE